MASIKYTSLLLLCTFSARAQSFSFSDLFGQANKQKQYYMQQIAAYNALESELKQGYKVIKNGLGGIRDINTAELNAHTAFYKSLSTPSASVKSNGQIKDILSYQSDITKVFSQNFTGLNADEQTYVAAVKSEILQACSHDLNDLQSLIASGQLKMSDDERLKRLNAIHSSMLDKDEFSQNFTNSLKFLAIHREQEANDAQTLNSYYENH